ncbi:MAG: enoyl-CoA hydratase-related protein [Kiritimatiellae bacterium]|nr:enoyl-CoA hydratase-related protein [Kiritimatiellia bacterium]
MKKNNNHARFFKTERISDVICLHFAARSEYVPGMLVEIVNDLKAFLSDKEKSSSNALVFYPPPGIPSPEKFETVLAAYRELHCRDPKYQQDPMARHALEEELIREINATYRLVKGIYSINEFTVAAMSGKTVFSLFGPALACDLRVVAEDFMLINRAPYSQLTPWGALPWFLTRFLGHAKTRALLADEKDISAGQALELGLVDKIVRADQLKETSVSLAQTGALLPRTLKQAMAQVDMPLERYLETEKSLVLSSLG